MGELVREMTGMHMRGDEELFMYELTNQEKRYGAAVLLLPDDQQQEYDFYGRMVSEVNRTQGEPEEVLSYSLYRYNRINSEIEEIIS